MGTVVRFSEFNDYLKGLTQRGISVEGTILDANVIITQSYSPKKFNTRVTEFIREHITGNGITCFTTVNTSQEYLEFHRRLLLTEGLRTSVHQSSGLKLPNKKRAVISAQSSKLSRRERESKSDPVFYDRELKIIRDTFCRSGKDGLKLWELICDLYLKNQLTDEYHNLQKLNIDYISMHKSETKDFFIKELTWENAIDICGRVGAGFSDSMILNALQCTSFQFCLSFDSDLAFAVLSDDNLKDVIMPDELINQNESLQKLLCS